MSAEQEADEFAMARTRMVLDVLLQVANLGIDDYYREGKCIFCNQPEPTHYHTCAVMQVRWLIDKKMVTLP